MAYPDWVLRHKKKGTYVNFANGTYYLYAAHSKRIPGTKKVKRICDGYLGRITEAEGFIPTKDKVSSEIVVYEYGLSYSILQICEKIHKGFIKTSKDEADFIMVMGILKVMHNSCDKSLFFNSYLSVLFPDVDIEKKVSHSTAVHIERAAAMIDVYLNKKLGEDRNNFRNQMRYVFKVNVNSKWYLSKTTESVIELMKKYKLEWGE